MDINETNFPDQIFRGWLLDKGNLNGMGADGVLTSGELAQITVEWYLDSSFTRPVRPEDQLPANGQTVYARWVPTPTPCITGPTAARAAWSPSPPSTARPLP